MPPTYCTVTRITGTSGPVLNDSQMPPTYCTVTRITGASGLQLNET
jgi:hypothetical protein